MKIESANVNLQAAHSLSIREETHTSVRVWRNGSAPAAGTRNATLVSISEAGRDSLASTATSDEGTDESKISPRLLLIRHMIEMLTGRGVRVFDASRLQELHRESTPGAAVSPPAIRSNANTAGGLEYTHHTVREEAEQTSVAAQGVLHTADGRDIAFHLTLTQARHYQEESSLSLRIGSAPRQDPLVINFDGKGAALADQRFLFDLNTDGAAEAIPLLASGSGYLALDLNGNGAIDSGAELFGPGSGSGYGELATLDQDGNGWIDEGDDAYSRLRIWTPDAEGAGTLETLAERQIGALFLRNVASPFELRGQGNSDLGAVKASGLYLTEDGTAGIMQEIDLSVDLKV